MLVGVNGIGSVRLRNIGRRHGTIFPTNITILQTIVGILNVRAVICSSNTLHRNIVCSVLKHFTDRSIHSHDILTLVGHCSNSGGRTGRMMEADHGLFRRIGTGLSLDDSSNSLLEQTTFLRRVNLTVDRDDCRGRDTCLLRRSSVPKFSRMSRGHVTRLVLGRHHGLGSSVLRRANAVNNSSLICLYLLLQLTMLTRRDHDSGRLPALRLRIISAGY